MPLRPCLAVVVIDVHLRQILVDGMRILYAILYAMGELLGEPLSDDDAVELSDPKLSALPGAKSLSSTDGERLGDNLVELLSEP